MTAYKTPTFRPFAYAFVAALALLFSLVCWGLAIRAVWSETDPADGHGWGRQYSDGMIVPNPSPTDQATCAQWCASLGRAARWGATAQPCVCEMIP